ncbi:hypothetical protein, partial [Parageobacillus thermoglucosidasius]|uniref:hypothetical protein n=1 Tax=Parageobacillus thermoglucosidasius TaxID=1426 RepID=UPI0030C75C73
MNARRKCCNAWGVQREVNFSRCIYLGGHDSQALKEEYQKLSSSTYISPACFLNIAGVCHFFVCKHILNELEKMLVGNFS